MFYGPPRYSPEAAEYLATWLDGAASKGLNVSFIGIAQNEHPPCATSTRTNEPACDGI